MNHYEVLGVSGAASAAELRRAYLHLARQYHPDFHVAAGPSAVAYAEDRMREINLAWEVLGDDRRRRSYDRRLQARATAVTRS